VNVLAVSLAFLAGNLATVNPCGFAMLPAFLSFYVGADEQGLPSARGRLAQGLLVGAVVTVAFLAVFTVVGLPVAYGARALGRFIPWVTILIGIGLITLGIAQLSGLRLSLSTGGGLVAGRRRGIAAFFMFGVAYAVSSLGCTLPIFLSVVGSSLTTTQPLGAVAVFAAYGLGMGVPIMTLSLGAAFLRGGLARSLRRVTPQFRLFSSGLLMVVGAYLVLYWGSVLAAPTALATNPVVGLGTRISSAAQNWLVSTTGRWFVAVALPIVLVAIVVALRRPHAGAERIERFHALSTKEGE
jgi:cytochrome c biogenesis protein CcdA